MNLKLLKSTGIYTVLGFIPLISSFVLLPIYTQYLRADDYGVVSLSSIMEGYFFILITFGLHSSFTVYFFDYVNKNDGVIKLLSGTLGSMLALASIYFIALLFFGDLVSDLLWEGKLGFSEYGWFIFANAIFLALNQLLFQYYRISENLKYVVLISLIPFLGSTLGGLTGVIILNYGAYGSIVGKAIGAIIASLPFYVILFYRIGFHFDLGIVRKLFSYAYPFVLIFFITNMSDTADRIIMNRYFDLKMLGLYSFSTVIVSPVNILLQSYWNSVTPSMYRAVSENASDKAMVLDLGINGVLFVTLVSIWGLIMIVDPVVKFIANPTYHSAIYYVPLLAITVFGRAYNIIYTFNASFYKKTKYLPIINVVSLFFGVVSAFSLINIIGIWAIFVAVILSRLSQGIVAFIIDRSLGFRDFPITKQLSMVILTVVIILLNYLYIYKLENISIAVVNFVQSIIFFIVLAFLNRRLLVSACSKVFKGYAFFQ